MCLSLFLYRNNIVLVILADFDECQLWYCQCQEPLPPDPNRHPITPLKWIKCYISTLHLVSDHIPCLLEWQGLCVCACVLRDAWANGVCCMPCALVFVPTCVVCHHINPFISTRGFRSLRLTALWHSQWRWGRGGGASSQLCHLWAQLENDHPWLVSVVTERRLQEPTLPGVWAQRNRGWEVCRGIRQTNKHADSPTSLSPTQLCPLKQGTGRKGWDRKNHIFCHLSVLKGEQLTSHLHTHWCTHKHAHLAADWKRFSVYCRARGVDGSGTAPAKGLNIEHAHTIGRKNPCVIIQGEPQFSKPIQMYSFIG